MSSEFLPNKYVDNLDNLSSFDTDFMGNLAQQIQSYSSHPTASSVRKSSSDFDGGVNIDPSLIAKGNQFKAQDLSSSRSPSYDTASSANSYSAKVHRAALSTLTPSDSEADDDEGDAEEGDSHHTKRKMSKEQDDTDHIETDRHAHKSKSSSKLKQPSAAAAISAKSATKSSRSKRPVGKNDDSASSKRKEQNRAAQQAFRARKEQRVKELQDQVDELQSSASAKNEEINSLRTLLELVQAENMAMKSSAFNFSFPEPHTQAGDATRAYLDHSINNNSNMNLRIKPDSPPLTDPSNVSTSSTTSGVFSNDSEGISPLSESGKSNSIPGLMPDRHSSSSRSSSSAMSPMPQSYSNNLILNNNNLYDSSSSSPFNPLDNQASYDPHFFTKSPSPYDGTMGKISADIGVPAAFNFDAMTQAGGNEVMSDEFFNQFLNTVWPGKADPLPNLNSPSELDSRPLFTPAPPESVPLTAASSSSLYTPRPGADTRINSAVSQAQHVLAPFPVTTTQKQFMTTLMADPMAVGGCPKIFEKLSELRSQAQIVDANCPLGLREDQMPELLAFVNTELVRSNEPPIDMDALCTMMKTKCTAQQSRIKAENDLLSLYP